MTILSAKVQAALTKVDALSAQMAELKAAAGDITKPADITEMKEELKRDIIRERAMMEASLEHRMDQQMNRLILENDQTAALSRLEKRIADIEAK